MKTRIFRKNKIAAFYIVLCMVLTVVAPSPVLAEEDEDNMLSYYPDRHFIVGQSYDPLSDIGEWKYQGQLKEVTLEYLAQSDVLVDDQGCFTKVGKYQDVWDFSQYGYNLLYTDYYISEPLKFEGENITLYTKDGEMWNSKGAVQCSFYECSIFRPEGGLTVVDDISYNVQEIDLSQPGEYAITATALHPISGEPYTYDFMVYVVKEPEPEPQPQPDPQPESDLLSDLVSNFEPEFQLESQMETQPEEEAEDSNLPTGELSENVESPSENPSEVSGGTISTPPTQESTSPVTTQVDAVSDGGKVTVNKGSLPKKIGEGATNEDSISYTYGNAGEMLEETATIAFAADMHRHLKGITCSDSYSNSYYIIDRSNEQETVANRVFTLGNDGSQVQVKVNEQESTITISGIRTSIHINVQFEEDGKYKAVFLAKENGKVLETHDDLYMGNPVGAPPKLVEGREPKEWKCVETGDTYSESTRITDGDLSFYPLW